MKKTLGLSFMLGQYSLLWHLARPFVARHRRLRDDFPLRLVPETWKPPHPVDLWIQAASGGEAFLARQLLGALDAVVEERDPRRSLRILCTSCTRQGLEVLDAAREHGGRAWPRLSLTVRVFPLDEPATMRRARELASPKAVALLETELWPGLMAVCAEQGIPLVTVNGRMTPKSFAGYRWLRGLWKHIAPTRILAIDETDAARFASLFGSAQTSVMPNMKFDGVPLASSSSEPDYPGVKGLPAGLPIILLASVRKEEEELLETTLVHLREHAPDALIVVAPRHMERVPAWKSVLEKIFGPQRTILASTLEKTETSALPGQAVLWDRFGQLRALYARSDAVFVGGSLAPLGGQNFLEAAAQGRVPIIGPYWRNFSWVGEAFFQSGLGIRVEDSRALGPALLTTLRSSPNPADVREKVAAYIAPRRGGTRLAAEAVWETLMAQEKA